MNSTEPSSFIVEGESSSVIGKGLLLEEEAAAFRYFHRSPAAMNDSPLSADMEMVLTNGVIEDWSQLAWLAGDDRPAERSDRFWNTISYLWYTCRCGIMVRVKNSKLVRFVPFANPHFQNRWNIRNLLPQNPRNWPAEAIEGALPPNKWWCNAGLMGTRHDGMTGGAIWGTSFLTGYSKMLSEAASQLDGSEDVEVFLNKRDFPNVRLDGGDPYGMTFFANVAPHRLIRRVVDPRQLLPILSGYTGAQFADVPFPLVQDYEGPPPRNEPREAFDARWNRRLPCAIFRGSATGCGTLSTNNPRLALVEKLGPGTTASESGLFDVRITGRNRRLRKHPEDTRLRVLPNASENERLNFLTMEQQTQYRFAIYVEGHSAASRLGRLLREGFLVFAIKTWVAPADNLFFSGWLVDGEHFIWCDIEELPHLVHYYAYEGNTQAREIAWQATQFHAAYLTRTAIATYVAECLKKT